MHSCIYGGVGGDLSQFALLCLYFLLSIFAWGFGLNGGISLEVARGDCVDGHGGGVTLERQEGR